MTTISREIVDGWIVEQATTQAIDELRFVVESGGTPASVLAAADAVIGTRMSVEPLFEEAGELSNFLLLRIPDVRRPDRADLFEVAAALRAATNAVSVEPDTGSDFFQPETPPPATGTAESAGWTFWCWAEQLPSDQDWAIKTLRVPEAWEYSKDLGRPSKGRGVVIFQPDTGVMPAHVAMPVGIADDPRGANFLESGKPPIDPALEGMNPAHGTGTCSVIACPGPAPMQGAAPEATLVPIRCVKSVAVFDQSQVAKAVDHARRQGAHVITMSLGGIPSRALHAAVQKAVAENVIVVSAAGNCVAQVVWPARYSEVICVGGINENLKMWQGSCRGPSVALSGPAEFVLRADGKDPATPPRRVSGGQGTSFATALTAAVCALWQAHHGREVLIAMLPAGRTLQGLFRDMARRSVSIPPDFNHDKLGAGVLDALALLKLDPSQAPAPERGQEAATESPDQSLRSLLEAAFGEEGPEAASLDLYDVQHHAELASVAFDRIRAKQTLRGQIESLPPPSMSPSLRQVIGFPLGHAAGSAP